MTIAAVTRNVFGIQSVPAITVAISVDGSPASRQGVVATHSLEIIAEDHIVAVVTALHLDDGAAGGGGQ